MVIAFGIEPAGMASKSVYIIMYIFCIPPLRNVLVNVNDSVILIARVQRQGVANFSANGKGRYILNSHLGYAKFFKI